MFEEMQFGGRWRDYQQRVLDEFDHHLDDDRVNVVAAPGSGKTVLGLELMRRLGRPTIVLAPSITIRNQWAERLSPLFMHQVPEGFASFDLSVPAKMTAITYQALHSIWADEDGTRMEELKEWADTNGPLTLVLDEAHHLRREWWRALDALISQLENVRIVALTATPPYDAPLAEWRRFEEACGPIDIEIGIPELVRNGDLCPHQDHIVFSRPNPDLLALLDKRRAAIAQLVSDIRADTGLADAIEEHPWLVHPEEHLADILDAPTVLSCMLVHLAVLGRKLPKAPLKLLGVKASHAPHQDDRWFEALLNALLYDLGETSPLERSARKVLADRLHSGGLIEGERVRLGETKRIVRMMAGDRAKLGSIRQIVQAEAQARGKGLRMVVLADHVRAGEMPRTTDSGFSPAKIGVVPIFEVLRREMPQDQQLAILTGTLVVLPSEACAALGQLAVERGISQADLQYSPLRHCDTHQKISARGVARTTLVALVTELFQRGEITILVGTQALLGEGWDAPAINSLILASNSASYMLSNQMRGRAIRIDPARPEKVSNIWHLATVPNMEAVSGLSALAQHFEWGGIAEGQAVTADMILLARRFQAFAGIANDGSQQISTGITRLAILHLPSPEDANAVSFARAADLAGIAADWQASLGDAPSRAHVREVAEPQHSPKSMVWGNTIEALGIGGVTGGAAAGSWELLASLGAQPLTVLLAGATTTAALASMPKIFRAVRLGLRNGTVENTLVEVGNTILFAMHDGDMLSEEEYADAGARVDRALDGSRAVFFEGLSRSHDIAAMDALAELLGPIENPRYLLVRKGGLFRRGQDFHAIPAAFCRNRDGAERFAEEWSRRIGPCRAVWTRSAEGRKVLLKARRASLSAGMQRRLQRRSEWR